MLCFVHITTAHCRTSIFIHTYIRNNCVYILCVTWLLWLFTLRHCQCLKLSSIDDSDWWMKNLKRLITITDCSLHCSSCPNLHQQIILLMNFMVASCFNNINTLRTGDANLRFYITTAQDGWRKSAFLTRTCFPCTIHLIMQYMEPVSEWSCWQMFIETWPHSELKPGNVHLNNLKAPSSVC